MFWIISTWIRSLKKNGCRGLRLCKKKFYLMLLDIKPIEKHEPDIQVDKDHVIRNYPIKEITFQDHHKKWQKIKFVGSVEETKDQLGEIFKVQHYKKGLIKKNMIIVDIGSNIC